MRPGETVPDVPLRDASGAQVSLHRYLDRPTIVQCLRYFG